MKIRITGVAHSAFWYADKVGEVFEVEGENQTDYYVDPEGSFGRRMVEKTDCEIVTKGITVLPDDSLGGILREYREVKREAAVGERIKVVAIHPESSKNGNVVIGEVFTAKWVDVVGDILDVKERDICGMLSPDWKGMREYVVLEPTDIIRVGTERLRMVDRKAAVGERVIVTGEFYVHKVGAIFALHPKADVRGCGHVNYADGEYGLARDCYRVLEPVGVLGQDYGEFIAQVDEIPELSSRPATDQIAENIAALTAQVQALETQLRVAREDIVLIEEGVADDIAELRDKVAALEEAPTKRITAELMQRKASELSAKKSPQQIRDEIVERAKADIEALLDRNYPMSAGYSPSIWFTDKDGTCITDKCEFVVNRDKRTVVALISDLYGNTFRKGIAKCAPNDVFNAHVGRAIALRRALGLEIPAEYLSVPGPEETRVGDVVYYSSDYPALFVTESCTDCFATPPTVALDFTQKYGANIVIDDTREEAGDSASSAQKGAAA